MKIFGLEIRNANREPVDAVINTNSSTSLQWGSLYNQNNAMGLSTVYRCTQLISDSIATLPLIVETLDGVRVKHSLDLVFKDTDNKLTKFELMKLLVQSVILKGNGFIYIERNSDGSVKKLRFLESGDVSICWTKSTNTLYYLCNLITAKKIEPINMIHIKLFSYDGVNGISILNMANRGIKLANSTENSALNYYDSGMNISGVISVASSLTPQQIKDIKQAWIDTYITGNGGVAVLQGNMDYHPVSSTANEAQLLENRNYSVEDICRWFGINPLLLGMNSGATYASLEMAQTEFVVHTLLPYIVNIEEEFTKKLLKPSEHSKLKINLDETYLLRMDKTSEATYYSTMVNNGLMTRNEARGKLGLQPVEGGDDIIIPFTDTNQNTINQNPKTDE